MKLVIALVLSIGLLGAAEFVHAAPRGPGNGVQGTVSSVGSEGFAMTTKDGKTIDVVCNPNTKFMNGGEAASPKDIQVGVHVGVQGGMNSATQYTATMVTVLATKEKKKKA